MFDETNKKALELHKQLGGKLSVTSKVPILTKEELSLIYTPGVAAVCKEIFDNPSSAKIYTIKKNTVAVITDGSAVLGLGNLGPLGALPVMEGKCALLKEFADVDAFPICLDTQDVEEIIRTVNNIAPVFGGILLEDISAPRCFEIEERLKKELEIPVMHDDQHGTAVVVLAGLINSMKLKGVLKESIKVVVNGAGAAGTAITKLLKEYGFKNLVVCDSKGSISKQRKDLNHYKQELANICNCETEGDLASILKGADVFIGVSVKNILSRAMIQAMNKQPIIFALANPEPEIDPELAKQAGAFIVATGRSNQQNQINNLLAFPGIFRGLLDSKVKHISTKILIKAAENLARYVSDLSVNQILPDPLDRGVVKKIASAIL